MLRIDGSPNGAIYLDGGRVTFGESSGAPGIGVRLSSSHRLSEDQWRLLTAERPSGKPSDLLVDQGLVSRDELRAILRSATLDAIIALTMPDSTAPSPAMLEPTVPDSTTPDPAVPAGASPPPPPARMKFITRQRHWTGSMIRLDFETVRAEITRSADRPDLEQIRAGACPKLSDARRTWAIVSREQWLVACWIDGRTSAWDLAWRNGFALTDTADRISELAAAGLCTLVDPSELGQQSLPRRRRGATLPDKPVPKAGIVHSLDDPEETGATAAPPTPELLNRLLDGLRRME